MVRKHRAKQQARTAKQKARRSARRRFLLRRTSDDPAVRLHGVEKWPVVHALVASKLWEEGIGYLAIAREEPQGGLVFACFIADVYCLGIKNAFWKAGSRGEFQNQIQHLNKI